ncbi:MAG: oxidoreductase [Gammaproteobacteria bacterium]|nr:oxidoreductase [Gammaproteobacteria bacterium]
MSVFRALRLYQDDPTTAPVLKDEQLFLEALSPGNVTLACEYSSLNYKDALAITGKGKIIRHFPMIPGIDAAGVVIDSDDPQLQAGDRVVLTGHGVGENHTGGMAQRVRAPGSYLVQLPKTLSTRHAMQFGTGGLTGMLCVMALMDAGVKPIDGPVLVTGASGGVGTVATAILSSLGYTVHAVTGRQAEAERLTSLGAAVIESRETFNVPAKPLESTRWAGVVDTVGGAVLAKVLAQTQYGGTVVATGNAGGIKLETTVFPFILRNIRLQGVDSVQAPKDARERAWRLLAEHLPEQLMEGSVEVIGLGEVGLAAERLIDNQVSGRILIDVNR